MPTVIGHLFWDELLTFVVPVLLVLAAVRWAERRKPKASETREGPGNVADTSERSESTGGDR
jgi:cytochrome c oxidase assembly factor CtaG